VLAKPAGFAAVRTVFTGAVAGNRSSGGAAGVAPGNVAEPDVLFPGTRDRDQGLAGPPGLPPPAARIRASAAREAGRAPAGTVARRAPRIVPRRRPPGASAGGNSVRIARRARSPGKHAGPPPPERGPSSRRRAPSDHQSHRGVLRPRQESTGRIIPDCGRRDQRDGALSARSTLTLRGLLFSRGSPSAEAHDGFIEAMSSPFFYRRELKRIFTGWMLRQVTGPPHRRRAIRSMTWA